jgi:Peptidase family M28
MFNKPGILLPIAVILITWLAVHMSSTPFRLSWLSPADSRQGDTAHNSTVAVDTAFSLPRAYNHLLQIAKVPHSTGTPENASVRSYIDTACQQLGLATEIQRATSVLSWGQDVEAGNVYNITARLKGYASSKTVLVMAHYDSEPNAVGAGDDGASCAAMLETARILKRGKQLRNDVLFLFTDGEEGGLLGAHAFVQESPLLKEIGVVLNFDNRGSSGSNSMFETNPANGWVVGEYARSGAHKLAASLSYEVYKTLPNNTDYTMFKDAGIAGLNNAFIDGFVDYHSMTDRPENLDKRTFLELGGNMLSLVKHFGAIDIRDTKAPDITFFDIIGDWMISYPASLNGLFLVLTNLLLLAGLTIGLVRKQIRGSGFIAGVFAFPVVLTVMYFLSRWALHGIRAAYPLYYNYYSNAYNSPYFYLALTALGVFVFTLVYQWLLRKFSLSSLLAGIVLLEVIATDFLYTAIPTAIYFLCFPLLFFLLACLFLFNKRVDATDRPWRTGTITFVLLLPAILLLAPIICSFFVAFDLMDTTAFVVAISGLLLGLLLPILAVSFRESTWLIPGSAFMCLLLSVLIAVKQGGYSPRRPLKTDLRYLVNGDEGKAYWVTDTRKPDAWTRSFFPKARIGHSIGGTERELINEAPLLPFAIPELTVMADTIDNGNRILTLHCHATPGAVSVNMILDEKNPATDIIVNGRKPIAEKPGQKQTFRRLDYQGVTEDGFDVLFLLDPKKPFGLDLISRSMGLPEVQGFNGYPPGIIPGPGTLSNTTRVTKHYVF